MLKRMFRHYDYTLLIAVVALCIIGLVMIYSSSMITAVTRYKRESDFFFNRQAVWLIIASFFLLVTMIFPYKAYAKLIPPIVLGTAGLLILLRFIGHTAGNAKSWLGIGGMGIQPAEFAKIVVIMYLSTILGRRQQNINNLKKAFFPPLLLTIVVCGLVAAQPDLGTASIIGLVSIVIMASSGINRKTFVKLSVLALIMVAIATPIVMMKGLITDEQVSRFTGAVDPFKLEKTDGYQLVNSYLAIGSGGLGGRGLGESIQKYGYLPESHTDFIMAVIAEELGFFGVAIVLFLLAFIVLKSLLLARRCTDPVGSLFCIGVATMITVQTSINLGGLTGLIPITGVPLPFISYGGSSLIVLIIAMGIILNISMFVRHQEWKQREEGSSVDKPAPFSLNTNA